MLKIITHKRERESRGDEEMNFIPETDMQEIFFFYFLIFYNLTSNSETPFYLPG